MGKKKRKHHDFGLVFWTHFLIILLFWLLPFLVNWVLVLASSILYYANDSFWAYFIGLCPLTAAQFNTKNPEDTFYHYYLTKYFGMRLRKKSVDIFASWAVPIIVFLMAVLWQFILGIRPLL